MRSLAAITVGVVAAAVAYWVGAVIAFLAMHGIPLGSPGGPPTRGDLVAHLVIALIASLAGAATASRILGSRSWPVPMIVGVLLAIGALLGFSRPASNWPPWFPVAMATACLAGAFAATRSSGLRP